jgi:hypothetical protein
VGKGEQPRLGSARGQQGRQTSYRSHLKQKQNKKIFYKESSLNGYKDLTILISFENRFSEL